MSTLQFIADLVSSLAWPTTTVVIVLVLRAHVPQFIESLRRMKLPGIELELRRARQSVTELVSGSAPTTDLQSAAVAATNQTPTEVIEAAFVELTEQIRLTLPDSPTVADAPSLRELMHICRKYGEIGNRVADSAEYLQNMRNAVRNGRGWASTGDAAEFVLLTNAVIDLLPQLGRLTGAG